MANVEKELEQQLEQAFRKPSQSLPDDTYFKKIWHEVECKAPVGERYYLRSFFSMFFVFVLFILFVFFYSDFLSSVLLLKTMREENAKGNSTSTAFLTSRLSDLKPATSMEVAGGVRLSALKHSNFLFQNRDPQKVEIDFFNGHLVVENTDGEKTVIIRLPDVTVTFNQGKCNIFCYDRMIRIIPLSSSITIETDGQTNTLKPGSVFYLMDGAMVK